MNKIHICIDDYENYREKFALWSTFCIITNGSYFPSEGWYDATSSILSMWTENMSNYIAGSIDKVELFFMDGDFSIQIVKESDFSSTAILTDPSGICKKIEHLDVVHFCRQLLSACGRFSNRYIEFANTSQVSEVNGLASKLRVLLKDRF